MRNRSWAVTAFAAVQVCLAASAVAQEGEDGEKLPRTYGDVLQEQIDAHRAGLEAREKKIDKELASFDRESLPQDHWAREWAGTYCTGDGWGMNVIIMVAPEAGVTYTLRGSMGVYDLNHGEIVEALDDGLRLKLAFDPDIDFMDYMDDRLYFVRWGERRYLVPERKMMELVNNYNEGGYARAGMFGMPRWYEGEIHRRWGEEVPEGVPQLPAKWGAMLLDGPLELTITAVEVVPPQDVTGGVDAWSWSLEFSSGRVDGVYEGMKFRLGKVMESGFVTITEVEEERCRGEFVCFTGKKQDVEGPEVGEKVIVGGE